MAKNPNAREPFDPGRSFVVVRVTAPVQGKKFGPKQPFDKTLVSTRRLRQMYDLRMVDMIPPARAIIAPPPPPPPTLESFSDDELREWLQAREIIPRRKATREKLLELAHQHVESSTHGFTSGKANQEDRSQGVQGAAA